MKLKKTVGCLSAALTAENKHRISGYCDGEIAARWWTLTLLNNFLPYFVITRLVIGI
jgi:hypothetical protein